MKYTLDGDQICITRDDFENLQESRAVFVDRTSANAVAIFTGGLSELPMREFVKVYKQLYPNATAVPYFEVSHDH